LNETVPAQSKNPMNTAEINRPPFEEALGAWKGLLHQGCLPTDLIWIFDENLCFEPDPSSPTGFRLGFQTRFTPPPPEAEQIAYDYFSEFKARLVFYRIGTYRGKSVCLLLCDEWFESGAPASGLIRRDEWLISFRPGPVAEIEEIVDESRWKARIVRDLPLHDLDFCMGLRSVQELMAHGRVLSAYERYALKLLHVWHRLLGRPD
jgi:hypothetical protein